MPSLKWLPRAIMYEYNADFYRYITRGSRDSARAVVPRVLAALKVPVTTVLDAGCGSGAWLSVWKEQGCQVTGIDGDYVDRSLLLIDEAEFTPRDLKTRFDLPVRYDLAQSLEVAEHLPESAAGGFVDSLCKAADIVLFSAAAPGQGGENHVNEQPYAYWQAHFERNGYAMYDAVRDGVLDDTNVMPWYRYNTFLYVKRSAHAEVHTALAECRIEAGHKPADKSPALYQLRKLCIRAMPVSLRTQIAVVKKKLQVALQRPARPA